MKPAAKITLSLALSLALGGTGWWLGSLTSATAPAPRSAASGGGGEPSATAPDPASAGPDAAGADGKASGLEAEFLGLLRLTPAEWPDRLRRAFKQENHEEIKWLAERWAARDPASLLAFMRSPDGLGFRVGFWPDWTITQACFTAWFRRDMDGALAAMEGLAGFSPADGAMSHGVWHVIMPTLMRLDPARALQFLGDHPRFIGGLVINYDEYRRLAPLALNMPECAGRKPLLTGIFNAFLHAPDPEKGQEDALAWLGKLGPAQRLEAVPELGYLDREEAEKVHSLLKKAFPPGALADLEGKLDGINASEKLGQLARLRALHDPQAAMNWAAGLKGRDKFTAMTGILEVSAPDRPEGAAAFLEGFPAGPLHDRALSTVVSNLHATAGPRAAADWLVSLPDTRDAKAGISQIIRQWVINQPADCAAWVGTLPSGPLRLTAASEALSGVRGDTDRLAMAARLPEGLGLEALNRAWGNGVRGDSRPIAEAAAGQPPGPIREAAMAKASGDARMFFNGYTQAWLDWAVTLPTPADRAAALRGAEVKGDSAYWGDGIREEARRRLAGE